MCGKNNLHTQRYVKSGKLKNIFGRNQHFMPKNIKMFSKLIIGLDDKSLFFIGVFLS